jgi:hypothetical protein
MASQNRGRQSRKKLPKKDRKRGKARSVQAKNPLNPIKIYLRERMTTKMKPRAELPNMRSLRKQQKGTNGCVSQQKVSSGF